MALGDLLKDLRITHGLTQLQLSAALNEEAGTVDGTPTVAQVKKWENGKVIPGPFWLPRLAQVLHVSVEVLTAEANLSRMKRRAFLSLTALVATHGVLARDMIASVASNDAGPLASVQTTHGTDLVIASLTDIRSAKYLRRWMVGGESATLRVNAAGILAKMPGQAPAAEVVRVLAHDVEARQLYMTAVLSRVGALEWPDAQALAVNPLRAGDRASFLAARLAAETINPRDAGARWCSATLLQELTPLLGWEEPHDRP